MTLLRAGATLTLLIALGCTTQGRGKTSPTSSQTPGPTAGEAQVPDGYGTTEWNTPKAEVQRTLTDLKASTSNGKDILKRETRVLGHPAAELYFFDDNDRLVEVELRLNPKISPEQSAEIARDYSTRFGPKEVTRADATRYQFLWAGADTDIYLTYDITDAVPEAPLINYIYRKAQPKPSATEGQPPSVEFGDDALSAMTSGWSVVDALGGKTRFVMILGMSSSRRKLTLDLDPATGHVTGFKRGLPYEAGSIARTRSGAEAALKVRFATIGGPIGVLYKGKGKDKLIYLIFQDGSFVALHPGAPKLLFDAGGTLPEWLTEFKVPEWERQ